MSLKETETLACLGSNIKVQNGERLARSRCGHFYRPARRSPLAARIGANCMGGAGQKGLIRQYLMRMTGLSRAHDTISTPSMR